MKKNFRNYISKRNILIKCILILVLFNLPIFFLNCSGPEKTKVQKIVVGIPNDASTINPLYAFNVIEGHLIDLLYLKPAIEYWNDSLGIIDYKPMLAKKWEWNSDSSSITLYLRDDAYWSDGKKITTEDIVYSFDIYSDPKVESRFLGEFKNFYTLDGMQIDTAKSFKVISPEILKINFKEKAVPDFLDLNLEILPRHIWEKYKREELSTANENFEPITSGPFKLIKWDKNSAIHLGIDSSSFLFNPDNINGIIFKIIPDYKSRITQLITGEIDLAEGIKSEDIGEISKNNNLRITSLKGREFDYIGWNHIDPKISAKNKSVSNKLFASPEIRKALGYAINKEEILKSYLGQYGEICNGPVSPIFKKYYDDNLKGLEYNPSKAKEILKEQGWSDKNNDAILEKGNTEFKFDLFTNSGNPRREYAATIIKNNLREVGIDANVQILESAAFIQKLMKREFDAWISGWTIPLPIALKGFWYSDKNIGIFNFSNYFNNRVDNILDSLESKVTDIKKASLYKELQQIFYKDQPVTYLYWVDNIIVYNKRLSKIKFSILGLVKNAWEWKVSK
jgi:peptide/nickel transport system substrate-binding protein